MAHVFANDFNWARYGLDRNPFDRERLNPLEQEQDAERVVVVDGFRVVTSIDQSLRAAVERRRPGFFLVVGEGGCGRSSAANYLLDRYREIRGVTREHFVVVPDPNRVIDHYSPEVAFQEWAEFLINQIEFQDVAVGADNLEAWRTRLAAPLTKTNFVPALQGLVRRMSIALRNVGAGMGVCFEEVRDYEFVASALRIFDQSEVIVVMTALDSRETREEIVDRIASRATGPGELILLDALDWSEVEHLIRRIWEQERAQAPLPFEFVGDYPHRRRPLARALRLFGKLLELKLAQNQRDDPYPDDPELGYSAKALFETLKVLESGPL